MIFRSLEDILKIDQAICKGKLGYKKLGDGTYLAFLSDPPEETHALLKIDYEIAGEIHWVQLPYAEITN